MITTVITKINDFLYLEGSVREDILTVALLNYAKVFVISTSNDKKSALA